MSTAKQATCDERIAEHLAGRMEDMRRFNGENRADEGTDTLYEAVKGFVCDDCADSVEGVSAKLDEDGDLVECDTLPAQCDTCGKDWPDEDGGLEDIGNLNEYGLSLDWVEPDEGEPYVQWCLSTGGPADEFRFYLTAGPHGSSCHRVEYWFLDWFDGAHRTLFNNDLHTLTRLWEQAFSELWSGNSPVNYL